MNRWFALMLLLVSVAFTAAGGDIAMFENLGFSQDADVFLFGQYGIDGETSAPYAEVHAVDVATNSFVPNGSFIRNGSISDAPQPLSLGQDGRGALYHLLAQAGDLISRYNIDHLDNGRPIYILVDGDEPRERIAFRDFNTSTRYEIALTQEQRAAGETVEAAFHITLTTTGSADQMKTSTIGLPGYFREDVARYRITQVLLNPDEDGIIIVVEKKMNDGSIRYMVETAPL